MSDAIELTPRERALLLLALHIACELSDDGLIYGDAKTHDEYVAIDAEIAAIEAKL
jgi:hypothetical protein